MDFYDVLDQVLELLQRHKRVTYRALQRQFALDAAYLEDLKAEIIEARQLAVDEGGRVLIWTGAADAPATSTLPSPQTVPQPAAPPASPLHNVAPPAQDGASEAQRRQLTVLFCDLVDSTPLARQLDPEEYREVIRAYQTAGADVIQRFDGYIAQYLGDGLLVYFGYPQAHEDDAQRAVRAGLEILDAIAPLKARLAADKGLRLAVRLGIHTGLVVVGAMGARGRREALAVGDTPNITARLQGLAAPDTVVISDATWRLVQGYFACDDLGSQFLKGVETPVQAYRVLGTSEAQSRLDVVSPRGLTPLVGRETEVTLLHERWAQARDGLGQVVVLSGEAGIGKSRLVMAVKEYVAGEPHTRWECRCSPYFQDSALYPLIDRSQRALQFGRDESPETKFQKLEAALERYGLAQPDTVGLWAAFLSVPLADSYPPLNLTPQRQKQQTLEAIVALLLALAAEQPVLFIVEDVHWIDPSTLEFLALLIDQVPTARLLTLLTCRPEFSAPWGFRAHLTPLTLTRLPQPQVAQMSVRVAGDKALPPEVVEQIVAKTDGVPLFVEELTKTVLESGLLQEAEERYELTGPLPPMAIPATLHDSLMARLDRLATVKDVAQLGSTIGRTFAYELLQGVSPLDDATLQHGLRQLVEAELVYQRGVPPQATYTFKHALVQDVAYQSLLRSTRQQYHQCIAQVLAERFPETVETQPELLAHHYTEAGLSALAVGYWQRAGQRASERSAYVEAVSHLCKGVAVLQVLPDTPARLQQELALQTTLGPAFIATRGYGAPEVAQAYTRARELCRQMGETPDLFPVLRGLWVFHEARTELQVARELAEQLLVLAQRLQDPVHLIEAHRALGNTLFWLGEFAPARIHLEQGMALYDFRQHRSLAFLYGTDPAVICLSYAAWALWLLGYPDQARRSSAEALTLAQELSHSPSLAVALVWTTFLHQSCREVLMVQERAEALMDLAAEQGFQFWLAVGTMRRDWVLVQQGRQSAEEMAQLRQRMAAYCASGAEPERAYWLVLLAEAQGTDGQADEGLGLLREAVGVVKKSGAHYWEAELYRLQGDLLLQQTVPDIQQAEVCFCQALATARRQQAKSLELRAAMSLARLWQRQGKRVEARRMLVEVYGWFSEGFDTADLREARALLDALT
jgi:class 3 adenylate cyclase/predicted ATPase